MNDLTDLIYMYVDCEGNLDPQSEWSEADLRQLISAAEAEIRRRAQPQEAKHGEG